MNNQAVMFFIELWNRLKTKSPKIFRVLSIFGASLTFAGYVPSMLQRWFNVEVPGNIITLCEDVSKYAAGFFAATMLPTTTKPVAQTEEGAAVLTVDEKKMPYTAAEQKKKIDEAKIEVPVIEDVPKDKPAE